MTYPTRKNLLVSISPTPYDQPLLMDMVPASSLFFLGVDVETSNPGGVSLVGSGGAGAPYSYSIISGSLPAGLSLNGSTGAITGTPTAQGVVSFVAEVQDSASNVFPHSFTINVESGLTPVVFQPTTGEKSVPYRFAFIVRDLSGTTVPSGYTVSVGTLPSGLSLSTAGVVSGTPGSGAVGVTQVTINVSYLGMSLDIPCTFTIADVMTVGFAQDRDPPAGWGGGPGTWLPSVIRGVDYQANILITGGVPPYSISVLLGDPLPTGFTLFPQQLLIRGKTLDTASTSPTTLGIGVTDALGSFRSCIRVFFIIDSQQGRLQPRKNGIDVGSDGPLHLDFIEGDNVSLDVANDGDTTQVTINANLKDTIIRARVATAAALPTNVYNNGSSGVGATLTAVSVGALTVDGVAVALNDILLVKNEATQANNGVYRVTTLGTVGIAYVLTRDTRMDGSTEFTGELVTTGPEGSANPSVVYECTAIPPVTVGTTAITFQVTGSGGGVASVTGRVVDNTDTANPVISVVGSLTLSIGRSGGPVLSAGDSRTFLVPAKLAAAAVWKMACDPNATCSLDIWYRAFGATRPTSADSVVNTHYPAISATNNASGTTSGWTTVDYAQYAYITFYIRSNDFARQILFELEAERTL